MRLRELKMEDNSPRRSRLFRGGLGLAFLTCVVYAHGLGNSFQYDDIHSIVENPHIRSLSNFPLFFTDPTFFSGDPKSAMYRPLVLVSYAFNHAISGYGVVSYHWFNLLVHAGNSLLVFFLLHIFGANTRGAFLGGLLFGLHPVNSEVVNYISSRSESVCALFFLLSFFCYASGREKGKGDCRWFAVSYISFFGALLSKGVGITLIGVLLAYEILYLRKKNMQDLRQIARYQWPFWGGGIVYLAFIRTMVSKALVEEPVRDSGVQLFTQTKGLVYYLKLLVTPVGLNVEHQFFLGQGLGELAVLLSMGMLVSVIWISVKGNAGSGDWLFWLIWPIIILLPTLIVPLNVLVNEHRLYLPMVAFAALGGKWLGKRSWGWGALALILLLCYGALAHQRTREWRDRESLWGAALARSPLMPRPHIFMGDHFKERGAHLQALGHYQRALEVHPQVLSGGDQLTIYNNIGATLLAMGRFVEAVDAYQRALQIDSTYTKSRESLDGLLALQSQARDPKAEKLRKQGLNLMILGRLDEAVASLKSSLELQNDPQTWMGLALTYERIEDWEGALRAYEILKQLAKEGKYTETAEEKIRSLKDRL
jgi:protein O-mannosyl-transferase